MEHKWNWRKSGIHAFDCTHCGKREGLRFVKNVDGVDCYHCNKCGWDEEIDPQANRKGGE